MVSVAFRQSHKRRNVMDRWTDRPTERGVELRGTRLKSRVQSRVVHNTGFYLLVSVDVHVDVFDFFPYVLLLFFF